MPIDLWNKEIYLLWEEISNLLNSKLLRLNQNNMELSVQRQYFLLKENLSIGKTKKNLIKLDMMILEDVGNKWLSLEKWLNFPWDILNYSKLWVWNLPEVFYFMDPLGQERLWLQELLPTKLELSSSWLMVLKLCLRWQARQKEIWEKPLNKLRSKVQQLFSSIKLIPLHQTEKKSMEKLREELCLNYLP